MGSGHEEPGGLSRGVSPSKNLTITLCRGVEVDTKT